MKKDITELYCFIDDFTKSCKEVIQSKQIALNGKYNRPTRIPGLDESEIIAIILLFQQSPCKNFKYFYKSYLQLYKHEFPEMPSYERFIALMPRVIPYMIVLLYSLLTPPSLSNIYFIDSSSLAVCSNKRISRNKVFKGLAQIGKTTKGWFFGFKLHIIIDEKGNLVRVKLTAGNRDDRSVVKHMTNNMFGFLFGDKGYISKDLFIELYNRGLKLVTGIKSNMKNILMQLHDKIMLRKRSLVETVFDYLKNKFSIEHTRHRSPTNAFIHIISTLIHYQLKPTKPSITNDYCLTVNP